jgi:phosphonate transport system substrate-binding protein
MTRQVSVREWLPPLVLACSALLPAGGCDSAHRAVSSGAAGEPRDPEVLNVALLPDEAAAKVIQDNEGLKTYLEGRLGKPIRLHVLTSYAAMIEAVRAGNIDLAYFGPLSYCLAKSRCDIDCFAAKAKDGKTTYRSVLIANRASGVKDFAGVKGKKVAFGDVASTSSHLMPKYTLFKKAGLLARRDYQESFLGKHDVVAINVQAGNVDVGGLNEFIYAGLLERGKIDPAKVVVLGYSEAWPEYPWVYQKDLAAPLRAKIRAAFLELKDPAVLKPLKADGFAAMADGDYDVVRKSARELGINLGELEK